MTEEMEGTAAMEAKVKRYGALDEPFYRWVLALLLRLLLSIPPLNRTAGAVHRTCKLHWRSVQALVAITALAAC